MVIKTHYATESESPFSEGMMVSLPVTYGSMTYGPTTYEQPPLSSEQETTGLTRHQRMTIRKSSYNKYTAPVSQSSVQQNIPVQSNVQPVQQPQVQQDQDPVTPNLGRPSAFRRSPKRMSLSSNRNTSNVPETPNPGVYTESPEYARSRRIRADSIWWNNLITYYSDQNVRFRLSSIQLQELEKLDTKILDIRDNTGKYDCTLLMKKFLLLESYNIPDIGGVYDDETISKNFPMELLKMILINKGLNTDNLSKTQLINELNSYDRTILAFTMVSSRIWGPRI